MAIIVKTDNPDGLLIELKRAIDEQLTELWGYDESGDFYLTADKWIGRAWLRAEIGEQELKFGILGTKDEGMTASLYSAYHAYFIELHLTHLDKYFSTVAATAKKTAPDYF